MKKIFMLCTALLGSTAMAASLTISSNSSTEKGVLQPLSQEIIGIMQDSGLPFATDSTGTFKIELGNLKCLTTHRDGTDVNQPTMSVPTATCEINGVPFKESRALVNVLAKIEQATGSAVKFIDCASGKCNIGARAIQCHVDTRIKEVRKGRFSCRLTDAK